MKKIVSLIFLFLSVIINAQPGPVTPLNVVQYPNNPVNTNTFSIGNKGNRSLYIKNNPPAHGYVKFDSLNRVTIYADTNDYEPALDIRSTYNNNSYMRLRSHNISAYRLKNNVTGVEWWLQNQTYAGGLLGLDGISLGLTSNPGQGLFGTSKRGSFFIQAYYANTLAQTFATDTMGHVAQGTTAAVAASYRMSCVHRGGTAAHGFYVQGTIGSDVTASMYAFRAATGMSNTPYTLTTYAGFLSSSPAMPHASNVITNLSYFDNGDGSDAKFGTVIGYNSRVIAGTNRYNIYAQGTAPNYFAGAVGIGTTTARAGYSLHTNGNVLTTGSGTTTGTYSVGGNFTAGANIIGTTTNFKIDNSGAGNVRLNAGSGADVIVDIGATSATHRFGLNAASVPTMALSTTTLAAGNAGTIAVVTDNYFTINCANVLFNLADATDYYYSDYFFGSGSPRTTVGQCLSGLPYNCTLIGANITTWSASSGTTGESTVVNFRKGGSDNVISNAVLFDTGAATAKQTNVTGLNVSCSAGDTWEIKITTPTWVTNPTSACVKVTLYFARR